MTDSRTGGQLVADCLAVHGTAKTTLSAIRAASQKGKRV